MIFEKRVKEQSIISFCGIKKYDNNSADPTFVTKYNKKDLTFDEPILLEFTSSELIKLFVVERYDVLQPYYGEFNLQLLYMVLFCIQLLTQDKIESW